MKTKQLALDALKLLDKTLQFAAWENGDGEKIGEQLCKAVAALEADIAQAVEQVAEIIKFSDMSTASAIEKTRRYLTKMADKRQGNSYFYSDGFPREVIADDAAAALAVFEQLVTQPEPAVNAELLEALEWAKYLAYTSDKSCQDAKWSIDKALDTVRGKRVAQVQSDQTVFDDFRNQLDQLSQRNYELRMLNANLTGVLRLFAGAAYPVDITINPRGYNWSEVYLDQALQESKANAQPVQPAPQAVNAELLEALKQALPYMEAESVINGYGYYRPENPHNFHPDHEMCNEAEIANHKAACAAYDAGNYSDDYGDGWLSPNLHVTKAPWGIGTYNNPIPELEAQCEFARAAIAKATS